MLAYARLHADARHHDRARRALARGATWDAILRLAEEHALLPLLHRHLAAGVHTVPTPVAVQLQRRVTVAARRSLHLSSELIALLRECTAAGLTAVSLKGPVLAEEVYGSLALRVPRDLDLLFRPSELPRVAALLKGRAYRLTNEVEPALMSLAASTAHHDPVAVSADGIAVECHRWIAGHGARGVTLDALGGGLRAVTFHGIEITVLRTEEQLVYLCQHGCGHLWSRLEWLATIAELVRSRPVDWARVELRAREWRATRAVSSAMVLAHDLIGDIEVPSGLGVDRASRRLNRAATRWLASGLPDSRMTSRRRFVQRLRMDPTFGDRLYRCWSTAILPTYEDIVAVPLPSRMSPLYFLVSPLRRIWRGVFAARTRGRVGRRAKLAGR